MAKFDKVRIDLVMDMAKCDEKIAKLYLKAHKGNLSRAVIAAREDVELTKIGKMGPVITAQGLADAWSQR